eukprot:GEZU01023716.1.p1 GENE.GEZU01023716.1~~GEZU01023716.1.p1  ORF type:complete len:140 (-),score=26.51 GEZU01023716.1:181-546(-)
MASWSRGGSSAVPTPSRGGAGWGSHQPQRSWSAASRGGLGSANPAAESTAAATPPPPMNRIYFKSDKAQQQQQQQEQKSTLAGTNANATSNKKGVKMLPMVVDIHGRRQPFDLYIGREQRK